MSHSFSEFAERLARGHLKNTAAVEETNLGEICPDYQDTILNLTNQGLLEITTKLPLIRQLVDLTFVDDQFSYPLTTGAAYLDTTGLTTFVDESFVKVLDIYDADGKRYQPNTGGHIITPTYNTLRFTAAFMDSDTGIGPKVRIQYQAKAPAISLLGSFDLPPNMDAALQFFVAAAYFSAIGGKDNVARGDGYFALYLRHIGEDEVRNTSGTSEVEEDSRFFENGFV